MVIEEHMVCAAFNRMCCATYWFNPNILLHEKHYSGRLHYSCKNTADSFSDRHAVTRRLNWLKNYFRRELLP